jgi:hypothetical protein
MRSVYQPQSCGRHPPARGAGEQHRPGACRVTRSHLWAASDATWKHRDLVAEPIRSGAETFLTGTASCRIEVDDVDALYLEMRGAEVLHPGDRGGAQDTGWGTREFAALDLEGNLLTFFQIAL